MEALKDFVADVPDFPKKGVMFRDITPLLNSKFSETLGAIKGLFSEHELNDVDAFAGLDARGFIFASALSAQLGKDLVVIRKSGKLPPPTVSREYDLEYGSARIEMKPGQGKLIIVDDLIATGGSMEAAAELSAEAGYDILALACLIDLKFLNDFSWNGHTVRSVLQYHD